VGVEHRSTIGQRPQTMMFLDQDKENHIQQYGFVYIGVLTPQNQALILSCNFPGDSPASGAVVGAFQ